MSTDTCVPIDDVLKQVQNDIEQHKLFPVLKVRIFTFKTMQPFTDITYEM
jgi:hypothetical protein